MGRKYKALSITLVLILLLQNIVPSICIASDKLNNETQNNGNITHDSNESNIETNSVLPPTNLEYAIQQDNSIILSWKEASDLIAGYEVYRDDNLVGYTEEAQFIDKELISGTTYIYSIVACGTSGLKSDNSETIIVSIDSNVSDEDTSVYKTDRYIIKCKNQESSTKLKGLLNDKIKSSHKLITGKENDIDVIILNEKVKPEDFLSDLRNKKKNEDSLFDYESDIVYVQPDYEFNALSEDTYYDQQWGIYNPSINNTSQSADTIETDNITTEITFDTDLILHDSAKTDSNETIDYRIDANVPDAWKISKGEGIVVAVIDTGVDITQEDLLNNIWVNTAEIPDNKFDDDGNGYIDDINGWNFINETNQVHDQNNENEEIHGTHIAGIIAAEDNNNIGITGVAPDAKILPLKVFNNGIAYTSDIISAIEYAESMGVKIVNCSWGSVNDNPALKEAINNSNILFVCASGNSHVNIDSCPIYPASYDNENIITVASINDKEYSQNLLIMEKIL